MFQLIKEIVKSKTVKFIFLACFYYLLWYFFYNFIIHPWEVLDRIVINNSSYFTIKILNLLGFNAFTYNTDAIRTVGIDGTTGLWIGDPCNGLTLFALFTSFILAFPGYWLKKLIFIPAGIILIHFANIIRITLLCIILYFNPKYLDFNHTYTFTFLVYLFIFFLWYIWIKFFSNKK